MFFIKIPVVRTIFRSGQRKKIIAFFSRTIGVLQTLVAAHCAGLDMGGAIDLLGGKWQQ